MSLASTWRTMENLETTKAEPHVRNIEQKLHELVEHLRRDAAKVDDASAAALFETSAEVIAGLERAFRHFETKAEPAFQK